MRRWRIGAAATACTATTSFGQPELISLGALPYSPDESYAYGVNADGTVVVGESGRRPFYWTPTKGLQELEGGSWVSANAVSEAGDVIAGGDGSDAMIWRLPDPRPQRIPTWADLEATAHAVSGDGRYIVGQEIACWTGECYEYAFRWEVGSGDVEHLAGGWSKYAASLDTSADGSVTVGHVGEFEPEPLGYVFLWQTATRWAGGLETRLGDFAGGDSRSSATAVSSDGQVIFGWGTTDTGRSLFRRAPTSGMENLGSGPTIQAVAQGGRVAVGGQRIWIEGAGFLDLRELLLAQGCAAAVDWRLLSANDISPDGTAIVGDGRDPLGRQRAFLVIGLELTICYADCDWNGELTFFDFLCFQNAFAAGDDYADCDGSGVLDFLDFLCFQNAFAAGCP